MSAKGNKSAEKRKCEGAAKKPARKKIKFKLRGMTLRKSVPADTELIKVCGQLFPVIKNRPYASFLRSLVSIAFEPDWMFTAKACLLCMGEFDETTQPADYSCHPLCNDCYENNRRASMELGVEHLKVPEYNCPFCRKPNLVEPIFIYEGGEYTEDRSIEVLVSNLEDKTYHIHGIHDGKRFIGQCVLDHSKGWQEGLSYHIGEFHKLRPYLVCMIHFGLNTDLFRTIGIEEHCVFQGEFPESGEDVYHGEVGFDYKKPDLHDRLDDLYAKHLATLWATVDPPVVNWDTSTVITVNKKWFGKVRLFK